MLQEHQNIALNFSVCNAGATTPLPRLLPIFFDLSAASRVSRLIRPLASHRPLLVRTAPFVCPVF